MHNLRVGGIHTKIREHFLYLWSFVPSISKTPSRLLRYIHCCIRYHFFLSYANYIAQTIYFKTSIAVDKLHTEESEVAVLVLCMTLSFYHHAQMLLKMSCTYTTLTNCNQGVFYPRSDNHVDKSKWIGNSIKTTLNANRCFYNTFWVG